MKLVEALATSIETCDGAYETVLEIHQEVKCKTYEYIVMESSPKLFPVSGALSNERQCPYCATRGNTRCISNGPTSSALNLYELPQQQ